MTDKETSQKSGAKKPAKHVETVWSDEEQSAIKERAKELKAEARANKDKEAGNAAVLEKIAEMSGSDRDIAEKLHKLVGEHAPVLAPKTWYGMPAYAKDGKVLVFFQAADKFKTRYATLGFNDVAMLDEGDLWPTAYAVKALGAAEEKIIVALLKRAVG